MDNQRGIFQLAEAKTDLRLHVEPTYRLSQRGMARRYSETPGVPSVNLPCNFFFTALVKIVQTSNSRIPIYSDASNSGEFLLALTVFEMEMAVNLCGFDMAAWGGCIILNFVFFSQLLLLQPLIVGNFDLQFVRLCRMELNC